MWRLGVIIFILLGGYPSFQHDDKKLQIEGIKKREYTFVDKYWGTISDEVVSDCLVLTIMPGKRLSAEDALNHRMRSCCWHNKRLRALHQCYV